MGVIERIKQINDYLDISTRQFCAEVGVANGYLDKVKDVGTEKVLKILNRYPQFSPEWLLTGRGEMLKSEEKTDETLQDGAIVAEKGGQYINIKKIPLVSQSAAAGFGSSDFTIHEQDVKEYYVVPKFKNRNIDFMIEVSGSSMYPKYNSGDVVACTILRNSQFIQWNKTHVIATREQGILVKRLRQGKDEQHLLAVSDNKDYPPFEIPTSEITGIAIVAGVIRLE